jgi:Zn finger protein HypA/HybF involved in hydrogenase expression
MPGGIYRRREPEKSDFYRIVFHCHEEYEKVYPERFEKEYGYLRKRVIEVINKFLDCGILEHGMARVYCKECGHDYFVAFSCKTRFMCPSCTQKRKLIWTDWIKNQVFRNIPHRHWVFTLPRVLRRLFYKDRSLLAHLATCAKETLFDMFRAVYSVIGYMPGIVLSIQTAGDLMTWHPHIHCLVSDGVFDQHGHFHAVPGMDSKKAVIIFREKVFDRLKENNRISDLLISKMRQWNHSGFSVYNEVVVKDNHSDELEKLAQYIVHPTFFTNKIKYNQDTGSVIYKSRMHLGKNRNFEVLDAVEFLHRVCLHIPDAYESLIRYYGFYSNAARGRRKKLGLEKEEAPNIDVKVIDDLPSEKSCRKSWSQLIYKIYEVDPLKCPKCGSEMKIIAFIQDYQEIKKILKCLGLWPIQYPKPPPEKSQFYTDVLSKLSASKHLN